MFSPTLRSRSVLLAALLIGACDQTATSPPSDKKNEPQPEVYNVPVGDSPARGGAAAKVTIVAFSDFQCPFCSRAAGTLDQVLKSYGEDVRLVWKHAPLPFHERAMPAALAAEAAREQGKFWQMHDDLFARQQALGDDDLEARARNLGLDLTRWKGGLASETARARIDADRKLGERLGVQGTPTFFINGRVMAGAQPLAAFKSLVDEELKRANARLQAGTPRANLYAALTAGGLNQAPAAPSPSPTGAGCQKPGACAKPEPAEDTKTVYKVDIGAAPVRGPEGAPVTVVLFSDFECPFCRRIEPTIDALTKAYPGKVRVVWKHFPLPFHSNARPAAAAAMAAAAQGKFWVMHDKLVAGQANLDRASLDGYAKEMGLDAGRFGSAMTQGYDGVVDADIKQGTELGVTGTPTVFINGRKVVGARPLGDFKAIVDEELAKGG